MKLVFYPAFSDPAELADHYYRLHWFLSPFRSEISGIVLPVETEGMSVGPVPDYLDPRLRDLVGALPVSLKAAGDSLAAEIERADLVFVWKVDGARPHAMEPALKGKPVIRIDHKNARYAASYYLKFAERFEERRRAATARSREIFRRIRDRCSGEIGYVFGTGPGLANAADHDFSDGVSIACNSMVKNQALLDRLKPPLIVVADPIFHAGCSTYAAEFRDALIAALDRHDADLIIPLRDDHIYRTYLPERFRDRIASIPFASGDAPNINLNTDFHVTSTGNVLTLFLIPLAATFFREIRIFGCDGRPPSENAYFWRHDKASQFEDRMDDIKKAHPAFFAIDYDDYYNEHCATLEKWLTAAERRGLRVANHTESFIPALSSRSAPILKAIARKNTQRRYSQIVSLDPDAVNHFGHYLSYDERVGAEAARRGLGYHVVGRADFELGECNFSFHKSFTVHSWSIGNATKALTPDHFDRFERELQGALSRIDPRPPGRTLVYLYCGSLMHAYLAARAIAGFENVDCNINLFWTGFVDYADPLYADLWRPFVAEALEGERVFLTVPTREVQARFERSLGVRLPIAPHPSTTFDDAEAARLAAAGPAKRPVAPVILFPGGASEEKGFDLGVDAAITAKRRDGSWRCVIRALQPPGAKASIVRPLETLQAEDVEVSSEAMDDAAFASFLASGDVIVLPYRAPAFAERTSGLLIDAFLLGRPVVVIEGTWLAAAVHAAGCGVVAEPSTDSIVSAIERALCEYDRMAAAARDYAKRYLREHSWKRLVESLLDPAPAARVHYRIDPPAEAPATPPPDRRREDRVFVDETRIVAHLMRERTGAGHVMIDVGAHYGTSARYFADLGWTVHCFEPDENNRRNLEARLGDAPHVFIDSRAVSDASATGVSFFSSNESTGISGLHAFRPTHRESAKVDTITVAEIIEERKLDRVDFLKIDVEGFDLSVLRGVPWRRLAPDAVECEFEDAKTIPLGHRWRDIAEFLIGEGYAVYVSEWHPVVRYGAAHDWRRVLPYEGAKLPPDAWGNLLAFRDDPGFDAVRDAFDSLSMKRDDERRGAAISAARKNPRRAGAPGAQIAGFSKRLSRLRREFAAINARLDRAR